MVIVKIEDRHRPLFESLDLGVIYLNLDGVIMDANPAAERILGLPADEMRRQPADRPPWQSIREDGAEFSASEYPGVIALRTGAAVRNVVMGIVQSASAHVQWLQVNAIPIQSPLKNEPAEVLVTFEDITERKQNEAEVRRRKALLEAQVNATAEGILIVDNEGKKVLQNRQTVALWNIPQEVADDPDDRRQVQHVMHATRHPEQFVELVQHLYAHPEQSIRDDVELKDGLVLDRFSAPIIGEDGEHYGRIWTFRDITAFKRAEAVIRESRDMLVRLTDQVPGVVYQYRLYPDGRSAFPFSSRGMVDIYEFTPEEVQADATPVFGRLHPEDLDRVSFDIQESARTLRPFHCEFRVVLPRQGLRWRSSNALPERTEDGGTLWYGIIMDVTERKQAESDKANLEAKLQQAQKIESVGRLAGGVAHDFNNMLSIILGHVDMLLQDVTPVHPFHEALREINHAAERSADLTRQLLAFARKQLISPNMLDLNEIVAGMLKLLQRLIGENIQILWHPHANLWPVKMDPAQIDQILANLCVNARDAIADIGTITIETDNCIWDEKDGADRNDFTPGKYVKLAVSDNGSGMSEETLTQIFEPFFTTKALGEGTGLGLATVYGAVRQNNGFIDVKSLPGEGTTFSIYLPVFEGQRDSSPSLNPPASTPVGKETILLAEDEPSILKMTARMLERQGYTVLPAATVAEALRLAQEYKMEIHLIMTDVIMPEMNGLDLAEAVQKIRPVVRRLFVSGYTADVIAQHGILHEDVDFLQKPFRAEALATKVREALDRK